VNIICPATGKRSYRHYQQAAQVVGIARKQGRGLAVVPVSIYRCASCRRWHTTSMTQIEHEVRCLVRGAA
jgi:hypothetical protein